MLFYINLFLHILVLFFTIVSYKSNIKFWPPSNKIIWYIFWAIFLLMVSFDFLMIFKNYEKFNYLGFIFIILGVVVLFISLFTLGIIQTTGVNEKLVTKGIYKYTRNPQYIGDIIISIGLMILANSLEYTIIAIIEIIIYLWMPFNEEKVLEKIYSQEYINYKNKTPRWISFKKI